MLQFAINKSYNKADELGCESISLPTVSCGHFGFPKNRMASLWMQSVVDFQKEMQSNVDERGMSRQKLKLIRLVTRSPMTTETFLVQYYKFMRDLVSRKPVSMRVLRKAFKQIDLDNDG